MEIFQLMIQLFYIYQIVNMDLGGRILKQHGKKLQHRFPFDGPIED